MLCTGKHRNVDTILELIKWGANADIASTQFYPFQLVARNDKPYPYKILHRAPGLKELYRTHMTDIHALASAGKVRHLLEHRDLQKYIQAKDSYGETPLHVAAKCGHNEIVDMLLSLECDIACKDNWGFTPLHCACEGMNSNMLLSCLAGDYNICAHVTL